MKTMWLVVMALLVIGCGGTSLDRDPAVTCSAGQRLVIVESIAPYAPPAEWQVTLRAPTTEDVGSCWAAEGTSCDADVQLQLPADAEPPYLYVHDATGSGLFNAQITSLDCGSYQQTVDGYTVSVTVQDAP